MDNLLLQSLCTPSKVLAKAKEKLWASAKRTAKLCAAYHDETLNNTCLTSLESQGAITSLNASEAKVFLALAPEIPILSIIVPCHNAEEYISYLGRTAGVESYGLCEIIFVNNRSSDNTELQCIRQSNLRRNIRYVNCSKAGAGEARNLGAKHARGIFLYFLDADDRPNIKAIIESSFETLRGRHDLCIGDYNIFYEQTAETTSSFPKDYEIITHFSTLSHQEDHEFQDKILASKITGYPWNRIVKRILYERKHMHFSGSHVNNDLPFHWATIFFGASISFTSHKFCTHVKHASHNSLSKIFDERRLSFIDASLDALNAISAHPRPLDIACEFLNAQKKIEDWIISNSDKELKSSIAERSTAFRVVAGKKIESIQHTKDPKISIITVVRNINGFIPEANSRTTKSQGHLYFKKMIKSVCNQTYKRSKIEHIIIDGASTDGTLNIIKDFKRELLINDFISEPDLSVYDAMNKGLALSQGDYCLFLNADDYLSPNAIELLVNKAMNSGADYIYADAAIIDSHDSITGFHYGDESRIFFGMPYNHQTLLVSRKVYTQISFPLDYRVTAWKYSLNLFLAGFYGAHVGEVVAFFRLGGLSTGIKTRSIYHSELSKIRAEICNRIGISRAQYNCFKAIAEDPEFNISQLYQAFGSIQGYQRCVQNIQVKNDSFANLFLNNFFVRTIRLAYPD